MNGVREILDKIYMEGRSRKSFKKGKEAKDQAILALKKEFLGMVKFQK
jgi:hypothetical protein